MVILATIGFLNFQNYSSEARDAVRKNDFQNLKKALELYEIEKGEIPISKNFVDYEKFKGWKIGKIDDELSGKLRFNKTPLDPFTKEPYDILVSDSLDKYILNIPLESGKNLKIGNMAQDCSELKEKGEFNGDGKYTVYHLNVEPRVVYCKTGYNETFLLSIIGGDMEIIDGNPENNRNYSSILESEKVSYITDEVFSGSRALKAEGSKNILKDNFVYIEQGKKYKLSGKVKIIKKNPSSTFKKSHINFAFETFGEKDGKIISIRNGAKNIIKGTETLLLRDLNPNDDKIYFECDKNIYDKIKSEMSIATVVAFDVDPTGKELDLPNYNLTSRIGVYGDNRVNPKFAGNSDGFSERFNYSTGLLRVDGQFWGTNEKEKKTCILYNHKTFGKKASSGTNIRFHNDWNNSIVLNNNYNKLTTFDTWVDEIAFVEDFSNYDKFAKFIKIGIYANFCAGSCGYDSNGKIIGENIDTITYIDDLKFEVLN